MQQVFILVNRLLQKEHTSSKRNLSIRTYKVIPLSQRSGIVEWCEGTTPLGEYLIGPQKNPFQGAHYRYRPQDWTSMDCRRRLTVRWWLTSHCNWSRAQDWYKSHFLKIINVPSLSLSLSLSLPLSLSPSLSPPPLSLSLSLSLWWQEAGTKRESSKFEVYSKISRHFRPIFHHFFMERFASPSQWFERRLAYTRSVASSSIGQ